MDPNLQGIINFANDTQTVIDSLTDQLNAAEARISDAWLDALVIEDIEFQPWILASGTVANTPGSTATAVGTQGQPGPMCAFFSIRPNKPYADEYWYQAQGPQPTRETLRYAGKFLFPTQQDALASQALELDLQQCINGVVYNTGLQFDFAENQLRVWNRSGKAWVPSGQTCPRFTSLKWNSFSLETHRDDSSVYYDGVTINGSDIDLSKFSWLAPNLGLPDMMNYAVQLDSNSKGLPYTVYISGFKFSAK